MTSMRPNHPEQRQHLLKGVLRQDLWEPPSLSGVEVICPYDSLDPEAPCAMVDPDDHQRIPGCGLRDWLDAGGWESVAFSGSHAFGMSVVIDTFTEDGMVIVPLLPDARSN